MFRATELFHSDAQFVYDTQSVAVVDTKPRRAAFEPDEIVGTLMPVYSEIARRLSRNAYTSHSMV